MRSDRLPLAAALLLCAAWTSPAPDVVVYVQPTLHAAVLRVGALYRSRTGVRAHIFASPPLGLDGLIEHMARDDVVIADDATLDRLAGQKLIMPESRIALGRVPFVLAARSDSPVMPGMSFATLAAHHMVVVTDPTAAASFDGHEVLANAAPGTTPTLGEPNTEAVIAAVLADPDRVGVMLATDAAANRKLKIVAMPSDMKVAPQPFGAAEVTHGQSANAEGFLTLLATPAARALLQQAGLERTP